MIETRLAQAQVHAKVCAPSVKPAARTPFDHRSGGCSLDARRLYENKSGQDFCVVDSANERPDAACSLRGDPPDYENCARKEGNGGGRKRVDIVGPGLRDGRLLFAELAARGSEARRPARDLGRRGVRMSQASN